MHRGSSKGDRAGPRTPGILPLSASALPSVPVTVDLTRGTSVERRQLTVVAGTPVRAVLRLLGRAAEGSAVLVGDTPIPLDTPLDRPIVLTVLPTFSGG
jgi:sulfur carrier protein ThiS